MELGFDQKELLLRKKQNACLHPSYKCSLCSKYKDNLENEYVRTIRSLILELEKLDVDNYLLKEETVLKYRHPRIIGMTVMEEDQIRQGEALIL